MRYDFIIVCADTIAKLLAIIAVNKTHLINVKLSIIKCLSADAVIKSESVEKNKYVYIILIYKDYILYHGCSQN